jgi:Carboxypeptidase regulatory-like domain
MRGCGTSIVQVCKTERETGESLQEFLRRLVPSLTGSFPLLVAVALALVGAGHLARAQQALTPAGNFTVRGSIVNSVTGQTVPGALVALSGDFATLANGDGGFSFENVPGGQYTVSVRKQGFIGFGDAGGSMARSNSRSHGNNGPPRRIQVGPDMPNLTFRIAPTVAIAGQVTLSTADPADGIRVRIYRKNLQYGRPTWEVAGVAQTRSDGSFRLGDLAPGQFMVNTEASMDNPGAGTTSRRPVWGYPPVYYPGVTDPNAAGVMTVASGQQAEADFTLTRQQFFPVTAVVRTATPEVPANFTVLAAGGYPTGLNARYDAHDQVVHASVPNGTWTLDAHAYGRAMAWGRAEFRVAGAPVNLAINIAQIPRIPVVIRREFTSTTNSVNDNNPGMNLTLVSAEQSSLNAGGGLLPDRDSDPPSWQLLVLQPGRYWLQATPYPPGYINSITSGGIDLATSPLLLAPGSSPAPIDVTLRDDAATITGQLTGDGVATTAAGTPGETQQVWIYAIPLFATAVQLPEGYQRPDGTFTISDLGPGSYRVVACDEPQEIDFHTPEGLAAWAGKGQTVTVEAGGTATASVAVVHAEAGP